MKALGQAAARGARRRWARRPTAPSRASSAPSPPGWRRSTRRSLSADLARVGRRDAAGARGARWGRCTRSRWCAARSRRSSWASASRCAPGPGSRRSGTTSTRSTRRPTTPRATCRTPSSSRAGASCARTPRPCRSGPCWPGRRRCGSSRPATSSAATTTPPTRRCSRRWRGCYVDEDVSFADLKGTLLHFVHRFFGPEPGHPPAPQLLPVHRAVGRGRRRLLPVRAAAARWTGRGLPPLQGQRLD